MKCHSIDRGTPKRYRVVCKYKYLALNTLSGTKTQDFKHLRGTTSILTLFIWESSPPSPSAGGYGSQNEHSVLSTAMVLIVMLQQWQWQWQRWDSIGSDTCWDNDVHINVTVMATGSAVAALLDVTTFTVMCTPLSH